MVDLGRNDPCHCESGKKYKRCCLMKDEKQIPIDDSLIYEGAPCPTKGCTSTLKEIDEGPLLDRDVDGRKIYGIKPDDWLWCLHCERFFQSFSLVPDITGGIEGCPFKGCTAAGIECGVYPWDSWPKQNSNLWKHWPRKKELTHGMKAVLYPKDKAKESKK